jgi:hypothetical protein
MRCQGAEGIMEIDVDKETLDPHRFLTNAERFRMTMAL